MVRVSEIQYIDIDAVRKELNEIEQEYEEAKKIVLEKIKEVFNLEERAKEIHKKATVDLELVGTTIVVKYKIRNIELKTEKILREEISDEILRNIIKYLDNVSYYIKRAYMYTKDYENIKKKIEEFIKDYELEKYDYDTEKLKEELKRKAEEEDRKWEEEMRRKKEEAKKKLEEKRKELERKEKELNENIEELNNILNRVAKDLAKFYTKEEEYDARISWYIEKEVYEKLQLVNIHEDHYSHLVDDELYLCIYKNGVEVEHYKIKVRDIRKLLLEKGDIETLKKIADLSTVIVKLREEVREKLPKEIEELEEEVNRVYYKERNIYDLKLEWVKSYESDIESLKDKEKYIKDYMEEAKKVLDSIKAYFS